MQDLFSNLFEQSLKSEGPTWVTKKRKDAFDRFLSLGFPTQISEDWKYLYLERLLKTPFEKPLEKSESQDLKIPEFAFEENSFRLVFLNGKYIPRLSSNESGKNGVMVGNLNQFLNLRSDFTENYLGKNAEKNKRAFIELNTAFLEEGTLIHLPKNSQKLLIHLVYLSAHESKPFVYHPRNLIVAEEGAEATLVETYRGEKGAQYFTNAVTEVFMGEESRINHIKIQQESAQAFHIASLDVSQGANSRFDSHVFSMGGALTRNEINSEFTAKGGECTLKGLYLASGNQQVDNHTKIDHAQPHCTSTELYKGILGGASHGIFDGKIVVQPHAAKSNARQTNKNLLLSKEAAIDTKPVLEIFNNDVKCNHGATIGRLDEQQLFYLRSRGLDLAQAQTLLTYAFASEIVQSLKEETLHALLQKEIFSKIEAAKNGGVLS